MVNYIILILLYSFIYSESVTIYATESAQYYSNSNNGDSCCTPETLGYFNASEMSIQSCWSHNVYGNCLQRKHTAIWKFDLSEIPDNANILSANFLFNQSWEGYGYNIKASNEASEINNTLAYNLYSNPDWIGYADNTPNSLDQNIELPIDILIIEENISQLNLLLIEDGSYINNSGLNSPRIDIVYQNNIQYCPYMDISECEGNPDCQWVQNIDIENCNSINSQQECQALGCSWYNGNYYACSICCWGSYEIDNSYCEEIIIDYIAGDINNDLSIDILDVIETINIILQHEYNEIADMDNNEAVNILDIIQILNIIID